jgi:hypothetical protein
VKRNTKNAARRMKICFNPSSILNLERLRVVVGGITTVEAGKSRSCGENIYLILTLQAKQQD